jgi:hypothetical protein
MMPFDLLSGLIELIESALRHIKSKRSCMPGIMDKRTASSNLPNSFSSQIFSKVAA